MPGKERGRVFHSWSQREENGRSYDPEDPSWLFGLRELTDDMRLAYPGHVPNTRFQDSWARPVNFKLSLFRNFVVYDRYYIPEMNKISEASAPPDLAGASKRIMNQSK